MSWELNLDRTEQPSTSQREAAERAWREREARQRALAAEQAEREQADRERAAYETAERERVAYERSVQGYGQGPHTQPTPGQLAIGQPTPGQPTPGQPMTGQLAIGQPMTAQPTTAQRTYPQQWEAPPTAYSRPVTSEDVYRRSTSTAETPPMGVPTAATTYAPLELRPSGIPGWPTQGGTHGPPRGAMRELAPARPTAAPGNRQAPAGPRLRVDWPSCKAHGLCHEILPEAVHLDEWGYPVVEPGSLEERLVEVAKQAVKSCPTLALRLVDPR